MNLIHAATDNALPGTAAGRALFKEISIMCGICGFTGTPEQPEKILEHMLQTIRHRGPDGLDYKIMDGAALGFVRLSIIDLEGGMQPLTNEDGTKTLVFNGEIYNFPDLRKDLLAKGHTFKTRTDSETILHGFEEYGTEIVKKLRGMFAFAIWDESAQTLFCARDGFGIKPCYYMNCGGHLVFASEIKSLLQFPGFKKELNPDALEEYLSFQYSALPETFFKGIFQLPAGCTLTWHNGDTAVRRYFDPKLHPAKTGDESAIIKKMEQVIDDSVKAHMISDVEVGTYLSGGVDSSYVAASFTGAKAFTVGFLDKNSAYNEMNAAEGLAKKLHLEHHTRTITPEDFWGAIPSVVYHLDEPVSDACSVAQYFVAQEAAKKVKVVVSGEGADELFGGYNIYLEPTDLRWVQRLPKPVRNGLAKLGARLPETIRGRNYLIRAGKDVETRFIGNANIFSNEERRALLREKTNAPSTNELLQETYRKAAGLSDLDKMQYVDLVWWLTGDILPIADKMSMAHSLELRVPYLDREVFRLARKLPVSARINHHQTKYCFRKMTEKKLPQESSRRKKLGFPVPIRVWLKEEQYYSHVKEYFTGEAAAKYFHTDQLLKLLDDHKDGRRDNSRKIWTVYIFLVWYSIFFEGKTLTA